MNYLQDDLPVGPRTASLLPRYRTVPRQNQAAALPPPPVQQPPPRVPPPPPPVPLAAAPPLTQISVAEVDPPYYGPTLPPPPVPVEAAALVQEGAYSAIGVGNDSERNDAKSNFTAHIANSSITELDYAITACIDDGAFDMHKLVWINEQDAHDQPLEAAFFISGVAAARASRAAQDDLITPSSFPTTVEEAKKTKYWPLVKAAMEDEIKGKFVDNEAWDVVPREAWMHVIKSRWVLQFKLNDDHSLKRVKARFVGCGYSQIAGVEYKDIFSCTLAATSFRTICDVIADEDLETDSIDARRAFTQSDVDCDIYVEMPVGFNKAGHVLKLKKALEGIKQGSHLWFKLNLNAFIKLGCTASVTDPNILSHSAFRLILGVFADDVLAGFARAATEQYIRFKSEYASLIKLDHLEISPLNSFIGVVTTRDRNARTITLTQVPYVERLAMKYKGQFKERSTPVRNPEQFDKLAASKSAPIDRVVFLSLCGGLLWPANMTRPDVMYAVAHLCTFMSSPLQDHFDAALDILGYLVYTKSLGITFGGRLSVPMEDCTSTRMDSLNPSVSIRITTALGDVYHNHSVVMLVYFTMALFCIRPTKLRLCRIAPVKPRLHKRPRAPRLLSPNASS